MHNFSPHDENDLVAALRAGDESAFTQIVERYHANMVRIASLYVGDVQIAQEVTQETWVVVLHSLNRFEGRSSLKTWLFTILTNRAKTRAVRENRYVPLEDSGELDDELHQRHADRGCGGGNGARDHGTCEAGEPGSASRVRVPRHDVIVAQVPGHTPASRCSRAYS